MASEPNPDSQNWLLKIKYLWMSLAQRRRLRRVSLCHFYDLFFIIDPPDLK
jgi:hypothetical protein